MATKVEVVGEMVDMVERHRNMIVDELRLIREQNNSVSIALSGAMYEMAKSMSDIAELLAEVRDKL